MRAILVSLLLASAALAGCASEPEEIASGEDAEDASTSAAPLQMAGPAGWESSPSEDAKDSESAGSSAEPEPSKSQEAPSKPQGNPYGRPSGDEGGDQASSDGDASDAESDPGAGNGASAGNATGNSTGNATGSSGNATGNATAGSGNATGNATGNSTGNGTWAPFDFAAFNASGVDAGIAGYTYNVSIADAASAKHYTLDVRIGLPTMMEIRGHNLNASKLAAYMEGGGDAQSAGSYALDAPHSKMAQVLPLVHAIQQTDAQGNALGPLVEATLFMSDVEEPGYWPVAAVHWDQGGNRGVWEHAAGATVPYMAGPDLDDLAAFDALLSLYGMPVYVGYPLADDAIPDVNGTVDAAGKMLEPAPEEEPEEDPEPQEEGEEQEFHVTHLTAPLFNGTLPAIPGVQVSHAQKTEHGEQRFQVVFAPGVPLPSELHIEVYHALTGQASVHVVLADVALPLPELPPVPALPDAPDAPTAPALPDEPEPGLPEELV